MPILQSLFRRSGQPKRVDAPAPFEKVLADWRALRTLRGRGEAEEALREFESKNGVRLPADFRDYFASVDKTLLSRESMTRGAGLYSFWSLNEVRSVPEEWPGTADCEHLRGYFIFADWSISCWAYAICLAPSEFGKIRIIHTEADHPFAAGSFTEFIDAYIRDPVTPVG